MYNSAGASLPIYNSSGGLQIGDVPYLASANTFSSVRSIKEADTVFLLNRDVVAAKQSTAPAATTWPALLWVKTGAYGRKYSITIPGWGTAWYLPPDGGASSQVTRTGTAYIAQKLFDLLNGGSSGGGDGNASWGGPGVAYGGGQTINGSIINFPSGPSGASIDDEQGMTAMSFITKTIRAVGELPGRNVTPGFFVKVASSASTDSGSYYLRYDAPKESFEQVASPLEARSMLNPSTMPMVLYPYSDGFKLAAYDWIAQASGDSNTNPDPDFVGKPIKDIFFFQDRLALVAGEGVTFSETGEYGNFYRTTVADLIDSDPVGIFVTHPRVSTLYNAAPFSRKLLLFSDKAQFEVTYGDTLTPKSAATQLVTEYESQPQLRPVSGANSLFFPVDRGEYSVLWEYFLDLNTAAGVETAENITAHVPTYVPKGVYTNLTVSPLNNMVLLNSWDSNAASLIYVYQYYMEGSQRVQSAWGKWDMGDQVGAMEVFQHTLHLVMYRGDSGITYETMDLAQNHLSDRLDRMFPLESRPQATFGGDPTTYTWVDFPYKLKPTDKPQMVVYRGTASVPAGTVLTGTIESDYRVIFRGDVQGCTATVGLRFDLVAILCKFMVREQRGNGTAGVTSGRTQVGHMWVNYDDYGRFYVQVTRNDGRIANYASTGKAIGSTTSGSASVPYGPGRFGSPVKGRNTDLYVKLVADSPKSPSFLSVDWEGYHVTRGQRV